MSEAVTILETLKAAVKETAAAHERANRDLRDYQIANVGFALGDKVEYGYPRCRKIGLVVGFRSGWNEELRLVVAPMKKDGTAHATTRDSWPENPVKLEVPSE